MSSAKEGWYTESRGDPPGARRTPGNLGSLAGPSWAEAGDALPARPEGGSSGNLGGAGAPRQV